MTGVPVWWSMWILHRSPGLWYRSGSTSVWWWPQSRTRLCRAVWPPAHQGCRWWASHRVSDAVQPGKMQPPSRRVSAFRIGGVTKRWVRPTSKISEGATQDDGHHVGVAAQPPQLTGGDLRTRRQSRTTLPWRPHRSLVPHPNRSTTSTACQWPTASRHWPHRSTHRSTRSTGPGTVGPAASEPPTRSGQQTTVIALDRGQHSIESIQCLGCGPSDLLHETTL